MIARTIIVAAIITLPISVPFVTSMELRPMSKVYENSLYHAIQRATNAKGVLDINAIDELDPVHYRAAINPQGEADYDADMGREAEDCDRDNGKLHLRGGAGIAPWRQLGDVLPKVEAPSIVPDADTQADHTIAYLHKREASE